MNCFPRHKSKCAFRPDTDRYEAAMDNEQQHPGVNLLARAKYELECENVRLHFEWFLFTLKCARARV